MAASPHLRLLSLSATVAHRQRDILAILELRNVLLGDSMLHKICVWRAPRYHDIHLAGLGGCDVSIQRRLRDVQLQHTSILRFSMLCVLIC